MVLHLRNNEPDWTSITDIKDYLDEKGETGYYFLLERPSMCRFRLRQAALSHESIDYFSGDLIAEGGYKPKDLRGLPQIELDLLKRAKARNVNVRILSRWDSKSKALTYSIGEYVAAGIEVRKWDGEIRGGIYDGDTMYLVRTFSKTPPSELSPHFVETAPTKEIGKPQTEKYTPLIAIITKSPSLIKKFSNRFDKEFKISSPMEKELKKTEKSIVKDTEIRKKAQALTL